MFIKLEQWWLDYAYLEWRDPIAPFINTSGYAVGSSEAEFKKLPSDSSINVQFFKNEVGNQRL